MIFFSSDYHFGHDKEFLWGPRGLPSMFANSQAIVGNHNAIVKDEDDVYVLGDLMLGDNEYGLQMIKSLKGKDLSLIEKVKYSSPTLVAKVVDPQLVSNDQKKIE